MFKYTESKRKITLSDKKNLYKKLIMILFFIIVSRVRDIVGRSALVLAQAYTYADIEELAWQLILIYMRNHRNEVVLATVG